LRPEGSKVEVRMETIEEQAGIVSAVAENSPEESWPVIVAEGDKARRLAMLAWLKD